MPETAQTAAPESGMPPSRQHTPTHTPLNPFTTTNFGSSWRKHTQIKALNRAHFEGLSMSFSEPLNFVKRGESIYESPKPSYSYCKLANIMDSASDEDSKSAYMEDNFWTIRARDTYKLLKWYLQTAIIPKE